MKLTNLECKEKLFEATQLLMEIYQELSERTTAPKLTIIDFSKASKEYELRKLENFQKK